MQFNCSVMSDRLFVTPWTAARQASLSITNTHSLLKLMCTELVMPSNLIQAHPISSSSGPFFSCLQFFPASGSFPMGQLFTSGGQSIGASLLISFRIDWFDLIATQGTLKSLLQHQSSKASIFWCSGFTMVQC